MPSKLDYLSKYSDKPREDRKKKKSKKEKKHKKDRQGEHLGSFQAYDDDDGFLEGNRDENEEKEERFEDLEEEDRPTIVSTEDLPATMLVSSAQHQPRGVWSLNDNSQEVFKPKEESKRRRHDSSDDDSARKARPRQSTRKRHDSDSEDEEQPSSRPRRRHRRHDSEDERDSRQAKTNNEPHKRHDSSSEDDGARKNERHDSSPEGEGTRRRHRRSGRHDSDVSDASDSSKPAKAIKQENDSDAMHRHLKRPRRRYDSSEDDSSDDGRARMTSGHKAGLQNYKDFNKSEIKIQEQKKEDAQLMVDKFGMGETVYRDKDGKRTEQPEPAQGKLRELDPESQKQLNRGRVQKENEERLSREFQMLQESSFARHQDDQRLEAIRKAEIREGDPMAAYAASSAPKKKKRKKEHKSKKSGPSGKSSPEAIASKPMYKGPPAKPNRYGIRPGYRWDGVDRGNGFEDKLLAQSFSRKQDEEKAYRWRSADM